MCLENEANIYKGQLLTLRKKKCTRMKSNIGISYHNNPCNEFIAVLGI